MADKNRNLGNQNYGNQEWEKRRNQFNQKNEFNPGNTGSGFYDQNTGGYSGQVSRDNENESQGIYKSGGYNAGNQYSPGNQYGSNQYNPGNQYNAGNQYAGNNEYNSGNANQDYNRVNYFPDNDDNRDYQQRDYENNQYGTSGTYGYKGNQNDYQEDDQERYNRQQANRYANHGYKSDFEKHYYGQNTGHGNYVDGYNENRRQPRNRYGGDTSNYGNANQGGFDRDWWNRTKDEVASWFGDTDAERRRRKDRKYEGSHYGKGPKNYKRADHRIHEDVCDRLTEDDLVDASDIEVTVQGAEVVLTGYVSTRDQKRRAEDIVESVAGINHVENRLRVGKTDTTTGTTDIQ
jgi:osmotically-inducible protein OsmY